MWGDDLNLLVERTPKYCLRRSFESPIRAVVRSLSRLSGCRIEANRVGDMKDAITRRTRDIYELHAWGLPGRWEKDMCIVWVATYTDRQLKLLNV